MAGVAAGGAAFTDGFSTINGVLIMNFMRLDLFKLKSSLKAKDFYRQEMHT